MPDSYIEEDDLRHFEEGLLTIKWRYEHPLSFISRGKIESLFGGKRSFQYYYGLGISFSNTNVSISPLKTDYPGHYEHSFGVDMPAINVPADPALLRDFANSLLDIANSLESSDK